MSIENLYNMDTNNIFDMVCEWVISHLKDIFFTLILSLFVFLIAYFLFSFFVIPKYKHSLKKNFFPKENPWLGDNVPEDIYIKVQASSSSEVKEYDLNEYISKKLCASPAAYVILGNAGEGKTFSLHKIAQSITNVFDDTDSLNKNESKKIKHYIPVVLNLYDCYKVSTIEELVNIISENILSKSIDFKVLKIKRNLNKIVKWKIKKGEFVILFDGYDEIVDEVARLNCSKFITSFLRNNKNTNVIISSRTSVYEKEEFKEIPRSNKLYLSPFDKEQIREFISKFNFPENKSGPELYQKIINTPQIENVVTNPLLLTMIAHTYSKSDFEFSNSKTKLYEQCCDCLLKDWEENKKKSIRKPNRFSKEITISEKKELLSILAYELFKTGQTYIQEKQIISLLNNNFFKSKGHLQSSRNALNTIIDESGLIEITSNGFVKFHHRSFYEYFVALYLSENDLKIDLNNNVNQNIIFFYLTLSENNYLIKKFLRANPQKATIVCDVLLEKYIDDKDLITDAILSHIRNLNKNNLRDFQTLGYLANYYDFLKIPVRKYLFSCISNADDNIKLNILICFMLFEERSQTCTVFKILLPSIDLGKLVVKSGENLDDYANDILNAQESYNDKITFIKLLAKSYRFEAIYNIFKSNRSNADKKYSILGLLYMSRDISLFRWLNNKNFCSNANKSQKEEFRKTKRKYGWVGNELNDNEINCLFYLISLVCEILTEENIQLDKSLISHRVLFLISYIQTANSNKIVDLMNIENVNFVSETEFKHHWNQSSLFYNFKFFTFNYGYSIVMLNRITIFSAIICSLFQVIYCLYSCSLNLKNKVFTVNYINSEIGLRFNSTYILFTILIVLFFIALNILIKRTDYNISSIFAHLMVCCITIVIYSLVVEMFVFRMSFSSFVGIASFCEILKHRNNYPTLKNPKYTIVQNYLNFDNVN